MRCKACNVALDDDESTWKDLETGEFYDLCRKCWSANRTFELEFEYKMGYNYGIPKDTKGTSEETEDKD